MHGIYLRPEGVPIYRLSGPSISRKATWIPGEFAQVSVLRRAGRRRTIQAVRTHKAWLKIAPIISQRNVYERILKGDNTTSLLRDCCRVGSGSGLRESFCMYALGAEVSFDIILSSA